jgi:hypothetical protein
MVSTQLADTERQLIEYEDKNNELISSVNKEKNGCFEREKEFNQLSKDFELQKEKEVELQTDK